MDDKIMSAVLMQERFAEKKAFKIMIKPGNTTNNSADVRSYRSFP